MLLVLIEIKTKQNQLTHSQHHKHKKDLTETNQKKKTKKQN